MKFNLKITYLITLLLTLSLAACTNFRYTDYGRPFDFLKAKKYSFKSNDIAESSIEIDSAAANEALIAEVAKDSSIYEAPKSNHLTKEVSTVVDVTAHKPIDNVDSEKTINPKSKSVRHRLVNSFNKLTSLHITPEKGVSKQSKSSNWWNDFWKSVWRWFLKWLLIGILAALGLMALIIGFYYLLLLIGGPVTAIIGLTLIVIALDLFYDIEIWWIFNLL